MARRIPFPAGLMAIIVLVLVHQACSVKIPHHCPISSCGGIHNIKYPFRLIDDPPNCGDQRYNLSCENNQTVLYLSAGKYNVQEIYYEGGYYHPYRVRVVDSRIPKNNYSSTPHCSPTFGNDFRAWNPYKPLTESYYSSNENGFVFVSCEKPMNSPFYLNSSTCFDDEAYSSNSSSSHSERFRRYILSGQMNASVLKELCQVEHRCFSSWPGNYDNHISCTDVHNMLLYGFELLSSSVGYCGILGSLLVCSPDQANNQVYSCRCTSWIASLPTLAIGAQFAVKIVFGIPCVIVLLIYKWRRRHFSMYDAIEEFLQSHNNLRPIRYSYKEIKKMTNNFKDKLGEGGYGTVFKGTLRSGQLVAIKILGKAKANGQEFISEVATIGRIHHVNIVQLVGFCVKGAERALVYEFMPKGSLNKYIFSQKEGIFLSSEKLYDIALGVARGIEYLHRGCDMQILHFDIKPHNILLDDNFTPKVSDFGLARLYAVNDSIVSLTAVRGTLGYMAPELFYKNIGGLSYKADVYSFGMMLMEMAGRRKNVNVSIDHSSQVYFPTWVYDQLQDGKDIEIDNVTEEEKDICKKMIIVALWCIQMKPSYRPSMHEVVGMLEGELECLQMPPKPFISSPERPTEDVGDRSACSSTTSGELNMETIN
ncbi:hypothetical protein CJ030_MR7G021990 [Morella rubra]|uniref:Protein kinase domain-containing protein n=1 Tax=Morella rubra TaxID=262757 RepID=A0A6A1UXT1_9ROSI|nr:hypothetical protein CJ030_MR7G021990 [Morella rubra]